MKSRIKHNPDIRLKPRKQDRALWFGPAIVLGIFIVIFGAVLWLIQEKSDKLRHAELARSAEVVAESVRLRLQGNLDYLLLLAKERGEGALDADSFQKRAAQYVEDHPELINITWVSAGYIISDVAPVAVNRQILGLRLNLPEPARVSRLSRERRQPSYTRPFEAIQGKPSFEVWVPVFHGDEFLGLFAGVYSCEKVLTHLIPSAALQQDHVGMVDDTGRTLAASPVTGSLSGKPGHKVLLTSTESGVSLWFQGYGQGIRDWQLLLLEFLCLALVLGMAYVMWKLKREIEKHKQASEALQLSEARFKAVFAESNIGIALVNGEGRIVESNRSMREIFGFTTTEFQTVSLSLLIHDDYVKYQELFQKMMAGEIDRIQPEANRFIRKDGRIIWGRLIVSVVHDPHGKFQFAIGMVEDITEQKKLEEQLLQSQKMESIGTLAGGVAHDFNNILTVIVGCGSLIQMKPGDETSVKKYLDQIMNAAQRASALTHSLLAFSRKQGINPKPTDVNAVIMDIEKFLLRIIGEDVELNVTITDKMINILADKGQLEQVIMNLVTNARDAMPEGGIVSISTSSLMVDHHLAEANGAQEGKYACIAVADTGAGMDPETVKRIFEPFFTTKESGKGTGLGLYMVYGIVKQHNGFINVYSEPDTGTSFRIYLPVIQEEEQAAEGNKPNLPGGSETILLAEDDIYVRNVGVSLLESFGYNVITAVDGEDAVLKFTENKDRIDLVLLDVIMPKKNGKQAQEELSTIRPGVKVIFMSGYTADIIGRKGLIEENFDFITKPPTPHELLNKMREVLDRRDEI